jgi:glucose/arabinose dehydrogenase
LVTEQSGRLMLFEEGGASRAVAGVPAVAYAGQGGLGDVALHPDFARNRMVYLSWGARDAAGLQGAVVARARLSDDGSRLENLTELWRQVPFVEGNGHYSHRIEFGPDGMLYISSGERQKFDPAQDMTSNLGKIIRLTDAGQVPSDNPFADRGGVAAQVWALGVRNPLGIAFDSAGRLWEMEMGPAGGDELNLIRKGGNYGYPRVSNGNHYDGRDIPDHAPGDGFIAPVVWWNPVISPSSLMIYNGDAFPQWRGNAFVSGLSGTALVRLTLDGEQAQQANRWNTGFRVRMVTQDATGGILLLGDGGTDGEGKLYRLTPRR